MMHAQAYVADSSIGRDLLQNEEEMNTWVRTIPGPNGLRLLQ